MASFDAFTIDDEHAAMNPLPSDDGGYGGYSSFSPDTPPYQSAGGFPGEYYGVTVEGVQSPDPYGFGSDLHHDQTAAFGSSTLPVSNGNGNPYDLGEDSAGIFSSDGSVLPPPNEMHEVGFALREWRRQNAIRLEEKEKQEKEIRNQIIEEGEEYKKAFYEKRKLNIETNKTNNREKEKSYMGNQEKFHKEADKQYWKAIAELIPNEVPNIAKKGRKKDQEKKPSIAVIQGPKPGKPTELSRMRHILVKLKHNPPPHMLPTPPAPTKDAKDAAKNGENVENVKDNDTANITGDSAAKDSKDSAPTAEDSNDQPSS